MLSFVFWHQKRLAKQARVQEIQAKNASLGKKVKEPPVSKGMKGRGEASFYKVTCKVCQLSILTFYHVCNFHCLDLLSWYDLRADFKLVSEVLKSCL